MKRAALATVLLVVFAMGVVVYQRLAPTASGVAAMGEGESRTAGGSETHMITYREYLEAYWGPKWPELEAQLSSEQRATLNRLLDPTKMTSWESARPLIREKLRQALQDQHPTWEKRFQSDDEFDLRGPRLNPKARVLSAANVDDIQSIMASYAPEIDDLVEQTFDLTRFSHQA
jgi:hypothetical protein